MTKKGSGNGDYERGKRDGKRNEYAPPKSGEAKKNYDQGRTHGFKDRHKGKGGCFLTTACTAHAGLDDSCHELNTLRKFRDSYIASLSSGSELLSEYYYFAPIMVDRLTIDPESSAVLHYIYSEVQRAVSAIEAEKFTDALSIYSTMFNRLKSKYITPRQNEPGEPSHAI